MQANQKLALLGLPFDEFSSFARGCALAPERIRAALFSGSANLTSERGTEIDEKVLFDAGDAQLRGGRAALDDIKSAARSVLDGGHTPIFLGGDHSVTYPILRAYSARSSDLHLVHFDAHPDLYQEYEGNPYSHACPFARIMEHKLVRSLTQIGIRTMNAHQQAQVDRYGVKVIDMRAAKAEPPLSFPGPVYVSIDLDALDPAYAPGVSHHEPGGLSTRQVIDFIHAIDAPLAGADIVEYNPTRDTGSMTAYVAAKLLKELAGKMLSR